METSQKAKVEFVRPGTVPKSGKVEFVRPGNVPETAKVNAFSTGKRFRKRNSCFFRPGNVEENAKADFFRLGTAPESAIFFFSNGKRPKHALEITNGTL